MLKKKTIVLSVLIIMFIIGVGIYLYGSLSEERMYTQIGMDINDIEVIYKRSSSLTREVKLIRKKKDDTIYILEIEKDNLIIGQMYDECKVINLKEEKQMENSYFYEESSNSYIVFYIGEIEYKYAKANILQVDGMTTYTLEKEEENIEIIEIDDSKKNIYTIINLNNKDLLKKIIK